MLFLLCSQTIAEREITHVHTSGDMNTFKILQGQGHLAQMETGQTFVEKVNIYLVP
jgi:hypothetical protein